MATFADCRPGKICRALLLAAAPAVAPPVDTKAPPASPAPTLSALVAAAKPGDTIELEARTYELDAPLRLAVDRLTVSGKGPGKTILRARFKGTEARPEAILRVEGPTFATMTHVAKHHLAAAVDETATTITLAPEKTKLAPFAAGDVVLVRAPNDAAFLDAIGAKAWRKRYPYVRQTLAHVRSVAGPALTLDLPLGIAFPARAEIMAAPVLRDVVIKGMTLHYDLGAHPDPTRYENAKPEAVVDGIFVHGALAPRLEDLEILDAGRHAVHLDGVLSPRVEKIRADGAWNKGKEGNGYFRVARTYYGVFRDLRLRGLRHLAIQWSSHDNLFSGLDSDCDVNFHGGFTQRNRVEGATILPRRGHTWNKIRRTEAKSGWAPPDGPGNLVLDPQKIEIK